MPGDLAAMVSLSADIVEIYIVAESSSDRRPFPGGEPGLFVAAMLSAPETCR